MIEVQGLSKRFGTVQALSEVSFTVDKGQIVGFLGANGAGKTTTMDIICGCIGADHGYAKVAGFDITENPIEAKKRLGYLPDEPPLHGDMTVESYVCYAARLHGLAGDDLRQRTERVIGRLELETVRGRLVGNLSKGYRQRVGLAQALVHDPEVLILDEPTEGLDPNQIVQIRGLIRSLAGEHTILLSSHILSEVQNTCDSIVIIHEGRIVQQGTYSDLIASVDREKTYMLRVRSGTETLPRDMAAIRGVSNARAVASGMPHVEFHLDDPAVLDDVTRLVVDKGYGMQELSLKSKSLEDVFFKLTH